MNYQIQWYEIVWLLESHVKSIETRLTMVDYSRMKGDEARPGNNFASQEIRNSIRAITALLDVAERG